MNDLPPIAPGTRVGHVHLKVSDLDRAIAFYRDALGFQITQKGRATAFLSAGDYHHHIGLNTWFSKGEEPAPKRMPGLFHSAFVYPTRADLARALARLTQQGIAIDEAYDHGVSEALYLSDPDGNGVELYWDRDEADWPRDAQGHVKMKSDPLDTDDLLAELAD